MLSWGKTLLNFFDYLEFKFFKMSLSRNATRREPIDPIQRAAAAQRPFE
jgi:hypothetical protein